MLPPMKCVCAFALVLSEWVTRILIIKRVKSSDDVRAGVLVCVCLFVCKKNKNSIFENEIEKLSESDGKAIRRHCMHSACVSVCTCGTYGMRYTSENDSTASAQYQHYGA